MIDLKLKNTNYKEVEVQKRRNNFITDDIGTEQYEDYTSN